MFGARFLAVLLMFLSGCGGGNSSSSGSSSSYSCDVDSSTRESGFIGDESSEPEIEVRALTDSGGSQVVEGGDPVAMQQPPQGGMVIYVGARARNIGACGLRLTAFIRDSTSGQVRLDSRTVNLRGDDEGWGTTTATDTSAYANVSVCPNQWSPSDLFAGSYSLTVELRDLAGITVTKTFEVSPYCAAGTYFATCECICRAGYQLGESCN